VGIRRSGQGGVQEPTQHQRRHGAEEVNVFQYWEDFNSKYGFGDGESVPPDARVWRELTLLYVNALAEAFSAGHRLCKFDRPGLHNPYLIMARPVDGEPDKWVPVEKAKQADPALARAMDSAEELLWNTEENPPLGIILGQCINVRVRFNRTKAQRLIAEAVNAAVLRTKQKGETCQNQSSKS
jgi:hypothetical protein